MLVHGVRGDQLPDDELLDEELEVYGVDWEGLHDEQLLHSQRANNPTGEGWNSWVGQVGAPEHLNSVNVDPPVGSLQPHEVVALDETLQQWMECSSSDEAQIITLWTYGLSYVRIMYPHIF